MKDWKRNKVGFLRGCIEKCVGGVDRIMLGSGRMKGKSGSSGEEDILKELRGLGTL